MLGKLGLAKSKPAVEVVDSDLASLPHDDQPFDLFDGLAQDDSAVPGSSVGSVPDPVDGRRERKQQQREQKRLAREQAVALKSAGAKTQAAPKQSRTKVIPSVSVLSQVRRVDADFVEDYHGNRYAVWAVDGMDFVNPQVTNGWLNMLNALDFPLQVLVRQHQPDLSVLRREYLAARPEHMRRGRINDVGNSLLDYFSELENSNAGVLARSWYVICQESKALELHSALGQSGFFAHRLNTERLGLLVQSCVAGMGYGHQRDLYQMQASSGHLELNERFCAIYEVKQWPRRSNLLFLEQMLQLGIELDISIWIGPLSPAESQSRLQTQRVRFEGARLAALQKGKLVQPEVDQAIIDVMRVMEEVERGVSKLFRRSMTLAVYSRDLAGLKEASQEITGYFRGHQSKLEIMKFRQGEAFAAMMPCLRRGFLKLDMTDSGTMVRLFPFGPRDLNKGEGTMLGVDLRSRTPVIYDAFAPAAMNGHMVVMARSGAGKSFFVKLRVERESLRSIPCYIIDPEGEYGVITRALGGEVFVPGAPGYGLNPFLVEYTGDPAGLTDRITSLSDLVGVMLEGELGLSRKATINRCLSEFYSAELTDTGDGTLGRGGIKAFWDFLQRPGGPMGSEELAHLLSPFAVGSAQFLMSGDARGLHEYEAPVTSFNMKNLSPSLKPVVTSICAEVVWGLAVKRPKPRMLVVDECWTVLATPSGAESLVNMVKRARKYQLGLLTITQDVQDFLSENAAAGSIGSHAGRSLLQNSAMKLALSQDPAALPMVVEALGLNDDVGAFLSGALRGRGVLVGEDGCCYPIEIVSTELERELVTDNAWRQDGDALPSLLEDFDPIARRKEVAALLTTRVMEEFRDVVELEVPVGS